MQIIARQSSAARRIAACAAALTLIASTSACNHFTSHGRSAVERPPAADFGLGPRTSAHQLYTATLQPHEPLRLRRLQSMTLRLTDRDGHPVDGAAISIEGGMPEHSHGLPTRPKVSHARGDGVYEIAGLRFSMDGWWELTLAVEAASGTDRVTFNLAL